MMPGSSVPGWWYENMGTRRLCQLFCLFRVYLFRGFDRFYLVTPFCDGGFFGVRGLPCLGTCLLMP